MKVQPAISFAHRTLVVTAFFALGLVAKAQRQETNVPPRLNWVYQLDRLEKYRDLYGKVSVKQPDVWGRARLTEHQSEFEKEMANQLGAFTESLQGAHTEVDQSSLASSTSLAMALSGAMATFDNATNRTNGISIPTNNVALSNFATQVFNILTNTVTGFGTNAIRLEGTELLDQRARFLNHLHELRRINEGDDTADAPGYSMYLLRVPISVMPGSKTARGFGAEMSLKASLQFPSSFTKATFRRFVVNDLVQQLGTVISQFAERDPATLDQWLVSLTSKKQNLSTLAQNIRSHSLDTNLQEKPSSNDPDEQLVFSFLNQIERDQSFALQVTNTSGADPEFRRSTQKGWSTANAAEAFRSTLATLQSVAQSLLQAKRAPYGFPLQDVGAVYGETNLISLAKEFAEDEEGSRRLKIYGALQEQLEGAYDYVIYMSEHEWDGYTDLPEAIKARNFARVEELRSRFTMRFTNDYSAIAKLVWPVVVESLLLNERLREEILDLDCGCSTPQCSCQHKFHFYLPHPTKCETAAFEAYVKKRWPAHIFTIDPITQDQNIAETLSIRRQFQLAVAFAVATGKINASQAINYMKTIGKDFQTVALNRTVAGFVEGTDRFGWRFYPRFQAKEKSKNYAIEPGMRECVAMIILPSFAPELTFDTRSRWFALEKPSDSQPELGRLYVLSEEFKRFKKYTTNKDSSKSAAKGVETAGLPNDENKLKYILDEVETLLPLQTLSARVPFENTLGGFALLNDGVSALAPQLYGSYGKVVLQTNHLSPAYLIGNNFSIRGTKVIAGGIQITNFTLLSRQLMLISIPDDVRVTGNSVTVHVATPYGVTSDTKIPVEPKKDEKPQGDKVEGGVAWENPVIYARAQLSADGKSIVGIITTRGAPDLLPNRKLNVSPTTASFAFRFLLKKDDKHVALKANGLEKLEIHNIPLITTVAAPTVDFNALLWPQIQNFLQAAVTAGDLPQIITLESFVKLDTEAKELKTDNSIEIRITK